MYVFLVFLLIITPDVLARVSGLCSNCHTMHISESARPLENGILPKSKGGRAMDYIAFDSHKRYTYAVVEDKRGRIKWEGKIFTKGAILEFLKTCEPGSSVALETIGNWYWIVDEIEAARCVPKLVHAAKAKLMLGMVNKTDKMDARGLNKLQRTGTLPTVWVPPGDIRDKRELSRARMVLVCQRTGLKQRIHATLAKYGLVIKEVSDIFGIRGREILARKLKLLPPETRMVTQEILDEIDVLDEKIQALEERMRETLLPTLEVKLLMSFPGGGIYFGHGDSIRGGKCGKVSGAWAFSLLCGDGSPSSG